MSHRLYKRVKKSEFFDIEKASGNYEVAALGSRATFCHALYNLYNRSRDATFLGKNKVLSPFANFLAVAQ